MVVLDDDILIILIAVFATSAFIISVIAISFTAHYKLKDRMIKRLSHIFERYLVTYLLGSPEKAQKAASKIKELAFKSRRNQNLLIELLLNLTHNFSGLYADKVYDLYEELELYKVSFSKLRNINWHYKVRGIYELSTLEYEEAFDDISKLITHSNMDVRRNTKIALVKVQKKEALITLKDLDGSMSTWTFINIISTLKRNPVKLTENELMALKTAKNQYIQSFANELETTVYVQ